jgi:glycosyltransferase involved in cell wall biosynthesis
MRILYFSQLFYPSLFGGGEYIFYQWAKELIKKGHQVFVVTQRIQNTKPHEVVDGIEIFRVGLEIKSAGTFSIGISPNISFLVNSFLKGMEIVRKNKIDIIHSNTYVPVISAQWCATLTKKPHIATVHDVYHTSKKDFWKDWSGQHGTSKLTRLIGPLTEKIIARTPVTLYHTVSENSKSDLLALGIKKNIVVIPNCIDLEQYTIKSKPKNQAIFVGRLVFYKNLDVVIEAFKKVVEKNPTAILTIVGDGPYKEKIMEKSEKLGIKNNVSFVGRVSDAEKIRLITESKVLLNPSLVEGFGIVVLESFACGRPVIVSDIKPLSELVTDSKDGFVISAHDPIKWSERIMELLSNEEKVFQMGEMGRQKALSHYSISKLIEQLESLYESVIQK